MCMHWCAGSMSKRKAEDPDVTSDDANKKKTHDPPSSGAIPVPQTSPDMVKRTGHEHMDTKHTAIAVPKSVESGSAAAAAPVAVSSIATVAVPATAAVVKPEFKVDVVYLTKPWISPTSNPKLCLFILNQSTAWWKDPKVSPTIREGYWDLAFTPNKEDEGKSVACIGFAPKLSDYAHLNNVSRSVSIVCGYNHYTGDLCGRPVFPNHTPEYQLWHLLNPGQETPWYIECIEKRLSGEKMSKDDALRACVILNGSEDYAHLEHIILKGPIRTRDVARDGIFAPREKVLSAWSEQKVVSEFLGIPCKEVCDGLSDGESNFGVIPEYAFLNSIPDEPILWIRRKQVGDMLVYALRSGVNSGLCIGHLLGQLKWAGLKCSGSPISGFVTVKSPDELKLTDTHRLLMRLMSDYNIFGMKPDQKAFEGIDAINTQNLKRMKEDMKTRGLEDISEIINVFRDMGELHGRWGALEQVCAFHASVASAVEAYLKEFKVNAEQVKNTKRKARQEFDVALGVFLEEYEGDLSALDFIATIYEEGVMWGRVSQLYCIYTVRF